MEKRRPNNGKRGQPTSTAVSDLAAAVADVDLVIEAVPELPELKQQIFAQLDELAPPHAVLGTNTSSLSIADIALPPTVQTR